MKVLGASVREVARGIYAGRVAQLDVHAVRGSSGWRVRAADCRGDATIAYGIGATLELAEHEAQRDFVRRMGERRAARTARAA